MPWPRTISLRQKITLVIMVNTFVALCLAGIVFAGYGVYRFNKMQMQDLNALANVIGTNSTAALAFKDANSAAEVLGALAAKPHILDAAVYDRSGKLFATYKPDNSKSVYIPSDISTEISRFTSNRVFIFQAIRFDGEKVGSVFLEGDTVEHRQLLESYLFFFGLIVIAVSAATYGMAQALQRPISDPILQLAWTTKMVTGSRDYSIRAVRHSQDEVGVLIDGFNGMLEQIQERDIELSSARVDLEKRVEERTRELGQEVRDRQSAQGALHESEERIRLLLDSTAEAIYGIDTEGICTFCNPETLRLLGFKTSEDLLGRHMHEVMHHTHADGTPYPAKDCTIYLALHRSEAIHDDLEVFCRADGTRFPAEFWAHPIRRHGSVVGSVVTFLDITERKKAAEALWEAKEAAESASRAKSEFLANMSHEIRTPMNGIIGMTDLALDTSLTSEQHEYLSLVKTSADRLLLLVNDILDFSKIEAGKFILEEADFEVRTLIDQTLKILVVRADQKHLKLSIRVAEDVPQVVVGDSTRVRQLLINLVGNAIKFTDNGEIIVGLDLESQSSASVQLHLYGSDTGIGIAADKHELIFGSFSQADGSTTRRFGGSGLGLAISLGIVELMGGRIRVESTLGSGSVFHLTLPFKRPLGVPQSKPARPAIPQTCPTAPAFKNGATAVTSTGVSCERSLNILLAEDNFVNQKLASRLLEKHGHHVEVVDTGKGVLAALARQPPQNFDIILMDIQMPEMDGMAATAAIREQEKATGRHQPIMAMTAHAMKGDKERCFEGGMDGYLSKPIRPDVVFAEIERCLVAVGESSSMRLPEEPQAVTNEPIAGQFIKSIEVLDRASLLERVEGDEELLSDMVQLFRDEAPRLLEAMSKALALGDKQTLERSAHSMKGAAGNLSAKLTSDAAGHLEHAAKLGEMEAARADLTLLEMNVQRLLSMLVVLPNGVPK